MNKNPVLKCHFSLGIKAMKFVSISFENFQVNFQKNLAEIPTDPEENDSRKCVIERKLLGRSKCFKRCFVLERLGLLDLLKKWSRTGDRFTTISDLQNNEEDVSFYPGKRKFI